MRRSKVGIAAVGLVGSFVAIAASCGAPGGANAVAPTPTVAVTTPPPGPSASASAGPASAGVDLRNPANFNGGTWTDDDVIQALAADCNWDPGGCLKALEVAAGQSVDGIDFAADDAPPDPRTPPGACQNLVPLACAHVAGQSCAPDECSQTDYDCIPACDKSCGTCASKCASACESCKSTCKDDACKLTCARSCGECRQACVQGLDQCTSAHCSEVQETCFRERDDDWTKSTCPKVCPKVQDCVEKCPEIENDYTGEKYRAECAVKCLNKLGKGCPDRFARICAGDPNASVNFNAYHAARHAGD